MFDRDKDGVLSVRELQLVLRCLGLRPSLEQVSELAATVSCDSVGCSVSFNEYLDLISRHRRAEPDQETLLAMFKNLDPDGNEFITEIRFRKMMQNKTDISDNDVDEMIEEYRLLAVNIQAEGAEPVIFYKGFFSKLITFSIFCIL